MKIKPKLVGGVPVVPPVVQNVPVPDLVKLPVIAMLFPERVELAVPAPQSTGPDEEVPVAVEIKFPATLITLAVEAVLVASICIRPVLLIERSPPMLTVVLGAVPIFVTRKVPAVPDKFILPVTVKAPTPVLADTVRNPVPLCVKLPSTVIVFALALGQTLKVPEPVSEKFPLMPMLKPTPKFQMVEAPPTKMRLLYCLLATLVVKEPIVNVVAAVDEYCSVLPVIVLVAVVGVNPLLMSIVPLLAHVLLPLPVLVTL